MNHFLLTGGFSAEAIHALAVSARHHEIVVVQNIEQFHTPTVEERLAEVVKTRTVFPITAKNTKTSHLYIPAKKNNEPFYMSVPRSRRRKRRGRR